MHTLRRPSRQQHLSAHDSFANPVTAHYQIDGPSRIAWTLPYVVTVNNDHPFGMIVSFPKIFPGETDEEDDRLKWYGTTANKDMIISAAVSQSTDCLLTYICRPYSRLYTEDHPHFTSNPTN